MANDIIDINVYETVETVAITVNPNLTTVNINQITSSSGGANLTTSQTSSNFTINSDTGTDASVPLGNGTLAGATLNDYTTAEKNKLSGIATGAEVNVNADWNAVSGDAQILNKPTISGTNTGDQNLQSVTNLGSSTTTPITANSFIKSGGTSSEILAADGSIITAGTNITITGGQISSVGGAGVGGSSVNYYLNGGTSQGTFVGTTYYEFSKTAVIGTGADFNINTNGYIASFITDVADPSLLLIPAGNWNLEFFFSSSSAGGSPSFYAELYKYDGTTFTLIASGSAAPEGITNGTAIDAYFTALAVPETVLTVNDRLAIRVYVTASGKTITLHTQNGHLCEVITTFTAGLTALNGLQAQVQNLAVGTTGTDFAINSSASTHTFNLPDASATARGAITTGSQTIAGTKTFSSNIVIPATGSALILSASSGGTVSGLTTTTYPDLTELALLKGVTGSSVQTQLNGKQATLISGNNIKSINGDSLLGSGNLIVTASAATQSAYTMLANNTASTVVPTEQVYKSIAEQTYTASPTWSTTAPQTILANTYRWSQVGNMVTIRINLSYNTGGSNAQVSLPLPADLPNPETITGFTSASEVLGNGAGTFNTSTTAIATAARGCFLRRNAANNGYEFVVAAATAISIKTVSLTLTYFA